MTIEIGNVLALSMVWSNNKHSTKKSTPSGNFSKRMKVRKTISHGLSTGNCEHAKFTYW